MSNSREFYGYQMFDLPGLQVEIEIPEGGQAMLERIRLTDLAEACLTRARGAEAFENLRSDLRGAVELDLDADIVSSAFLDELILRLDEARLLGRVIFITGESPYLSKLAHSAGTRGTSILVQGGEYPVAAPVSPKQFRQGRATFAPSKQGVL